MSSFQVPQFIEEKPKIIGFLTLQQFFYVAGAAILSFLSFYVFNFYLWLLTTIIAAGIAIGLAFIKINGQSLPKILLAAVGFVWQPRQFIWQRAIKETELDISQIEKIEAARKSMNLQEKIKSLALDVATGKLFSPKTKDGDDKYQVVTFLTGEKKIAKRVDY
ncbi:MAG: PrgI family protein [Patescibacteria group bacterium]